MAILGRTERRLVFAIVLTAAIPLIAAIYFANRLVGYAFAQAFQPELAENLDRSLGVYQELAKAMKDGMRYEADAIASREPLRAAAALADEALMHQELDAVFPRYPELVSLVLVSPVGQRLAVRDRGTPVDPSREMKLEVRRPLGDGSASPELVVTFATSRARFDELEKATELVRVYHRAREQFQRANVRGFAALLVITIIVAVALGIFLARGVTGRLGELAEATNAVAAGNLRVRVPERGNDELTDLSRNFNRMLGEVEVNRARIEFLQRMSSWQEMARRLAHEIKNPLTPIILSVEECHRKYAGDDPAFRKLLDTTLEIVEDEVGTLRRLVGEFGDFARLPRAELQESDLGEFLRDEKEHMMLLLEGVGEEPADEASLRGSPVALDMDVPGTPLPAAFDRQMLHQVLANVVRNAWQAVAAHRGGGRVAVHVDADADAYTIVVDDDGPGVPFDMRASIFDPYVTTKADGTGLGLAIVKKIVVEHGGTVDVGDGPLGGASFCIRIPKLSSAAARALMEALPPTSRPTF
jgi:two-component system, NtrC family, nitrogen regulation sensor histidine kinase NtrY